MFKFPHSKRNANILRYHVSHQIDKNLKVLGLTVLVKLWGFMHYLSRLKLAQLLRREGGQYLPNL